ncbi:MAG: radical SAM family heme chaperone HemW [Chlorobi bacterium]|nr:radical SAM family heme chaperone HemW [Chlorobiota bacterium]
MAGIYIHIPFCFKRCDYCDFYKTTNISLKNDFLKNLKREISLYNEFVSSNEIETIYFGGGTPSVLKSEEVSDILKEIRLKQKNNLKEITFELNPDDGNLLYLEKLRKSGINRLSIGIQSFDDKILSVLNRRHNSAQAKSVVENARKAGFDNISIDLMYGLPGMTEEKWSDTINQATELNVEHISAYHLTYEKGTIFHKKLEKGVFQEIGEDKSVRQFRLLIDKLKNAGFEHYEISNFAVPGKQSIHNSNYWNGVKYVGLGPSAHSFDGDKRWWNVADIRSYIEGKFIEKEEVLSDTDRYNELVMLKLRTKGGITTDELDIVGASYLDYFKKESEKFIKSGDINITGNAYRISEKGIFISDYIISELFYYE